MNLTVSITDNASPVVLELQAKLRSRRGLHQAIGAGVRELVRDYTIGEAGKRHSTARGLGAEPSGFVGKAAKAVEDRRPRADADGVSILLPHPYFARAFGDVDIRPTKGRFLTIPLVAEAYNQRAYRVQGLYFYKSQAGKLFLAKGDFIGRGKKAQLVQTRLWYLLVPSVHQTQDRSRLPSDEAIIATALRGVETFFTERLLRAQAARRARNQ
jgi:hypothetical protein